MKTVVVHADKVISTVNGKPLYTIYRTKYDKATVKGEKDGPRVREKVYEGASFSLAQEAFNLVNKAMYT